MSNSIDNRFSDEAIIEVLEGNGAEEVDTDAAEGRFEDTLNELYSFECVGGSFAGMDPARVLKEMDPTAYRIGLNEQLNDMEKNGELVLIGPIFYWKEDVDEAIEQLEEELEDEEEDDDD